MADYPSVAHARLPQSYVDAKEALRACAKSFTPERYALASFLLHQCAEHDECATWAQDMETAASYCRVSDDDELRRLCNRAERARLRWIEKDTSDG